MAVPGSETIHTQWAPGNEICKGLNLERKAQHSSTFLSQLDTAEIQGSWLWYKFSPFAGFGQLSQDFVSRFQSEWDLK